MSVRNLGYFASLVLLVASTPGLAGSVDLSWDRSAGATGYKVHYGSAPGNYTEVLDVGNQSRASINNLDDCTKWHFAVSAYNGAGDSGLSNEVNSFRVTDVSPAAVVQGDQVTLTIDGAAFDPAGAELSIDNPDVRLENASVTCGRIQVSATVEPTAPDVRPAQIGSYTVTVSNPQGSTSKLDAFEILIDEARFDINQSDSSTDGRVDGKDVVWLARVFGECDAAMHGAGLCGASLYDPDFDFDGDGFVGGDDLANLGLNFGLCWNGSRWNVSACQTN